MLRRAIPADYKDKAFRAVKLHLNESEMAIATHRVLEATGDTIFTKTEKELETRMGTNTNLGPSWWAKTLTEYKFGRGVEHLLISRHPGHDLVDEQVKAAMLNPYSANPVKRSTQPVADFLSHCEELDEANFRYFLYKRIMSNSSERLLHNPTCSTLL